MLIALTPPTAASIMAARNSLLREMKHLAHHDHLTGALNRAGFWSAANELLQHLTVQRYPCGDLHAGHRSFQTHQ